jgi:hypothetical protein
VNADSHADTHERARTMIALSGLEMPGIEELSNAELSSTEQSWLAAHLESCSPCREFRENSREAIRALRAIPIAAGGRLVFTTQMRVRERAQELQRQQERLWVVGVCCAAVTLSSLVTTTALWRWFASVTQGHPGLFSASAWEGGFDVFYLAPAVFVGILLLARGTFLADHNGSYPD